MRLTHRDLHPVAARPARLLTAAFTSSALSCSKTLKLLHDGIELLDKRIGLGTFALCPWHVPSFGPFILASFEGTDLHGV